MRRSGGTIPITAGLMVLLATPATPGTSRSGARVAVEMEVEEHTHDSCTGCGCLLNGEIDPGSEQEWWISYGLVKPGARSGWDPVASSSRCGTGSFTRVREDFVKTLGVPYVILGLSGTPAIPPKDAASLKLLLTIDKLSGFDEHGQPVYARRTQKRVASLDGEIALPILVPDPHEEESFGTYEVLLRLRGTILGRGQAAAFGSIAVSSDVPAAEILLDGGVVGRIVEGTPTLLKNVATGARTVGVRDFSGREARQQITLKKDQAASVDLRLLDPLPAGSPTGLVPIGKNPQGYEEYRRARDGAMVVRVPAGEFLMGTDDPSVDPDQRPQHKVFVSELLVDKTEVTWRQFRKFAQAQGQPLPPAPVWGSLDDYAVSLVLWSEAAAYCAWIGGRLPTEAEWEKAARGTDGRIYPWGNAWDPAICNSIDGGPHRLEIVGSFPRCVSPYGALEMTGGVWEWCADWYGGSYYDVSPPRDPKGPTSGSLRVLRGASWINPYQQLTTPTRFKSDPTWRNPNFGFRCVQGAPE